MLTSLLTSLFGTRKPSDLARAALGRWEAWLQPISEASSVGTDPTYDDAFQAVREEVAKLSEVDDGFIVATTERLLKATAKDSRLAVYGIYGRMGRDGAEGVADGFELLAALVDRFGDTLLPVRAETRKAAIEWLAGDTFAQRLDRVQGLHGVLLERTLSAIALMTERTAAWPAAARPDLGPLFHRFQSRVEGPPMGAPHGTSGAVEMPRTLLASAGTPIASSADLLDRARSMAAFLRDQSNGYLAAWRLMRGVRWDTLDELPPHDASGTTRLTAPRAELRSHLTRLRLQKQWPELLERIEAAFAEGVNHFWLDLQYAAFVAQEQAGHAVAACRDVAVRDLAHLLERLPGLEQLAFSDGTPFADSATLDWVARLSRASTATPGQSPPADTGAAGEPSMNDLEAQAIALAAQQGLEAALAWVQALPDHDTGRGRFRQRLVMARVATHAGNTALALHVLAGLDTHAQHHDLMGWEPTLAFAVKEEYLRALMARVRHKGADKTLLNQQIETVRGELVRLDPVRAVTLP